MNQDDRQMAAAYQFALVDISHLLPDSFQISYIICFHRTLVQVLIWGFVRRTITKMANKMAATYQFRCRGRSNLVILIGFLSNFIYGSLPSKVWFKFQWGFCLANDNQDGRKSGHHLSVCTCGRSTLVIFYLISSKFYIWIASIKLWFKFEYGLCPTNNNQDGQQKWPLPISLLLWTVYLSNLLHDCFQISFMDYFYQTLTQVQIWAL